MKSMNNAVVSHALRETGKIIFPTFFLALEETSNCE
jgi:hypothetical protein